MRLLVNHQLMPFPVRPRSTSFQQSSSRRSQAIVVTVFFFSDVKKQRHKTGLEKYYQHSVSIENSVDLKVCFSLLTYKVNNLLALRSTNQITGISVPY